MAFDGIFISKIIEEIKPLIINKRIDKINQNDDFIAFTFGKNHLIITLSGNSGLFYLSSSSIIGIEKQFSNILKRQLLNYKLTSIEQHQNDRIIYFNFEGVDLIEGPVKKQLVLEAFGRNFNILLTKDNRIIETYTTKHNFEGDMVMTGDEFIAQIDDKLELSYEDLDELTIMEIVNKYQGVSPLLATYLQSNFTPLDSIEINPTKNLDNNQFYWFNLFEDDNVEHFETLSELLEYHKAIKTINRKPYEKFIKSEILKTSKKIVNLQTDLLNNKENILLKDVADQIYSSGQDLTKKCSSFNNHPLDLNLTLNENAQNFYSIYKKSQASLSHIENEIRKAKKHLNVLESLKIRLDSVELEDEKDFALELSRHGYKLKKQQRPRTKETKIMTINYMGATIYIGRNSQQNEYVFQKIAKNDDLWLHVKNGAGSHVIVKGVINPETIKKAAQYAAFYSVYKHSNDIPVDYTLVRYVTKVRKSLTFKTTYTNQKTIFIKSITQDELTDH